MEQPDVVVMHRLSACSHCKQPLEDSRGKVIECYQETVISGRTVGSLPILQEAIYAMEKQPRLDGENVKTVKKRGRTEIRLGRLLSPRSIKAPRGTHAMRNEMHI